MPDRTTKIYNQAYEDAKRQHQSFHESRYQSFASAVTELCTGTSTGIGPTVRVHAAIRHALLKTGAASQKVAFGNTEVYTYQGGRQPGQWNYLDACATVDPVVFGPRRPASPMLAGTGLL